VIADKTASCEAFFYPGKIKATSRQRLLTAGLFKPGEEEVVRKTGASSDGVTGLPSGNNWFADILGGRTSRWPQGLVARPHDGEHYG
jgi:hypothetical protein